jgi:hypothetical protein
MNKQPLEFDNVHEESEQKIREAVKEFHDKWHDEGFHIKVYGQRDAANFKVWITDPPPETTQSGPFLIPNTLDAASKIFDLLESVHDEWQLRTTPPAV